jgi:hypothetical protein
MLRSLAARLHRDFTASNFPVSPVAADSSPALESGIPVVPFREAIEQSNEKKQGS